MQDLNILGDIMGFAKKADETAEKFTPSRQQRRAAERHRATRARKAGKRYAKHERQQQDSLDRVNRMVARLSEDEQADFAREIAPVLDGLSK